MNRPFPSTLRSGSTLLGVLALLLLTLATSAEAQERSRLVFGDNIFRPSTRPVDPGPLQLTSTNRAMTLDVDVRAFQATASGRMTLRNMPLAPGLTVDLDLREIDLFEPGVRPVIATVDGDVVVTTTARLYRGTVVGHPQSSVSLSVSENIVMGHVTTIDRSYEISVDAAAPARNDGIVAAISYPSDALPSNMIACGVDDQFHAPIGGEDFSFDHIDRKGSQIESAAGEIEFAAVGAWEADAEYIALFASRQEAIDYMVQLIADVSAVYERDLKTQLTIGHMKLWDRNVPGTPYKETTIMQRALQEQSVYWRDIRQDSISRVFAAAFSGKPWVNPIGIAWLDALCQDRMGAFSAITRNNTARDRKVVAHELGHNFGSRHTHHCGWGGQYGGAIHKCAPSEGGSCFEGSQQMVGTIMSYCSQTELKFHPLVADLLKQKIRDADRCVSAARALRIEPDLVIFQNVDKDQARDTILDGFFINAGILEEITVTDVAISGKNTDQFEILDGMPPFTLEPGGTKKISVRFKAERTDGSTLVLTYRHTGLNPDVVVTFEGYANDARPVLTFRNDNEMIDWGERLVGSRNDTLAEQFFLNLGIPGSLPERRATLYITNTRIEGPDRLDFQLTAGSAPLQMDGQKAVNAEFRFTPRSEGAKQAWLVVESNSNGLTGTLDSFELRGDGKIGPVMELGIADLFVDFGDVPRNGGRDIQFDDFFRNVGGEPLGFFANIYVTDGEKNIFNSTFVGSGLLPPGDTLDLQLNFTPDRQGPLGPRTGLLRVISTDEDDTFTLRDDTIHLIGNVVADAGVHDDMSPDGLFYVTPNPTTGSNLSLHLAPSAGEIGKVFLLTIVDQAGREVFRKPGRFVVASGELLRIDADGWPSGVYYIRLASEINSRARKVSLQN